MRAPDDDSAPELVTIRPYVSVALKLKSVVWPYSDSGIRTLTR